MFSFFQKQQDGPFSLAIISIRAVGKEHKHHGHRGHVKSMTDVLPMAGGPMVMAEKQPYFDEYDPEVDGAGSRFSEKAQVASPQTSQGLMQRLSKALCGW